MKKYLYIIMAAIVVLAIAVFFLFGRAGRNSETVYLMIDRDDTVDSVYQRLDREAQPYSTLGFRMLNGIVGYEVRTGRYAVKPKMSMVQLFRNLRNHSQESVRLVIPEVRTLPELAGRLSAKLMLDSLTLARAFADSAVCRSVGLSPATMPTLFIPNTYEVWWDTPLESFLQRMKSERESFWTDARKAQAAKLSLTTEEVQTLASIVDAETSYNPEKERIAGLYLNRLHQQMPLQSDPTVIFAIGDFGIRRVSNAQTRYASPYNTYMNEGLPPGPIRIASIKGIDAVLNAEEHSYIYMCAKEDFSGSHNFSSSYAEHLRNAAKYTEALNQRGIKQ